MPHTIETGSALYESQMSAKKTLGRALNAEVYDPAKAKSALDAAKEHAGRAYAQAFHIEDGFRPVSDEEAKLGERRLNSVGLFENLETAVRTMDNNPMNLMAAEQNALEGMGLLYQVNVNDILAGIPAEGSPAESESRNGYNIKQALAEIKKRLEGK